jgi:predicted glycoside hydrolase/deacetylase ChbG (UPF0249 family)
MVLSHFTSELVAQKALAEKLGYTTQDKLLILHADDMGLCHSENMASILAMKIGMVNSAGLMMPCPWVKEAVDFSRLHPEADIGLELTMTCEWENYKWGPVAPVDKVPSLVDSTGFLKGSCQAFVDHAMVEEVEIEIRAQIEKALKMGIRPTHLDTHMGCLTSSPEIFKLFIRMGREYEIPCVLDSFTIQLLSTEFRDALTPSDMIISRAWGSNPSHFHSRMAEYYEQILNELPPGMHIIFTHLAYNNAEMQGISGSQIYWGAKWRQEDFDFFTSERCRDLLKNNNIHLITWRDIQEGAFRK